MSASHLEKHSHWNGCVSLRLEHRKQELNGEPFTDLLRASWLEIKNTQFGFSLAFRVCNFLRLLNSFPELGLVNNSNWWLEWFMCLYPLVPCCPCSKIMHCGLPQKCSMHHGSQCLEPAILKPGGEGYFLLLCLLSLGMRKIGEWLEYKA